MKTYETPILAVETLGEADLIRTSLGKLGSSYGDEYSFKEVLKMKGKID